MTTTTIDGQAVEVLRLTPNNAELQCIYLERWSAGVNDWIAWTDAPSVAIAFCTDRQGDNVITGLSAISLSAVDGTNFPGYYAVTLTAEQTALLDTAAYRGRRIFRRLTAGASNEVRRMTPVLVSEPGWTT